MIKHATGNLRVDLDSAQYQSFCYDEVVTIEVSRADFAAYTSALCEACKGKGIGVYWGTRDPDRGDIPEHWCVRLRVG